MIVAALQPGYLPWLGFFDLMKRSDFFVIEDSLKYTKQDWRNRNRIRTAQGFAYLTVPVKRGATALAINEVEIDNTQPWTRRNWNLLLENYRNAPFWSAYEPFLRETFHRTWNRLIDIDLWFIEFLAKEFNIPTPTALLSDLGVEFTPDKTGSLVELVRKVGADTFLEGSSGRKFIDTDRFDEAGLSITFQDYVCRPYRQQFEPFMSHLSAIDLLLNEGPAGAELI
jgi:hypothetical protein